MIYKIENLLKEGWVSARVRTPPPYYPVLLKHFPSGRYSVGAFDFAGTDWDIEGIGSLPFEAISHWMLIPEIEVQKND